MLSMFKYWDGWNWAEQRNWNWWGYRGTPTPFCDPNGNPNLNWYGVTQCINDESGVQRVQWFEMPGNNAKGQLSDASLSMFKFIQTLNLNQNTGLQGKLDTGFPCSVQNLEKLIMGHIQLQGSLPDCIGSGMGSRLVQLDLRENQLTGSLPASFGQLVKLQNLSLAGNKLYGTVPAEIGQMKHLGDI